MSDSSEIDKALLNWAQSNPD